MVSGRALLSVSDKTGLVPFAQRLAKLGYEIVSTGGTAKALRAARITVTDVSSVTGFPEILDGRVKTLHPAVFGGILAVRGNTAHEDTLREHRILPIDVVAVNLYPFDSKVVIGKTPHAEAVELIDVGGPSLIRAAAKNHMDVAVVVDPKDYDTVASELAKGRRLSEPTRSHLAAKAFAHTARYDAFIARYFQSRSNGKFPEDLVLPFRRRELLRYGENHHQEAALYDDPLRLFGTEPGAGTFRQLHGKPLSYNNLLDADAALETLKEFNEATVVIVKHATPSGIACAKTLERAWRDAYATDTYSPFGGVVACNRPVDADLARHLSEVFLELVLAPSFRGDALDMLRKKKSLRLLEIPGLAASKALGGIGVRSITGALLVQDRDTLPFNPKDWKAVTKKKPTALQMKTLVFAAQCVKHVKSNAVVFAKGTRTVGIGGGQTARVDATWIAAHKGKKNIRGSVLASEAFFPFRDAVDVAAQNGVVAIVQPGGSIRDEEVIAAANDHKIAMVLNGHRSFRH